MCVARSDDRELSIHGQYDLAFKPIHDLFQDFLDQDTELGASICINVNGKTVLDIWGGFTDVARTRPWTQDTITLVHSSSKVVTNLAAILLIDRGLLDPDERVAVYWPEFGANGKHDIRVWHILTHSSGLSGWDEVEISDLYNTARATDKLARQAPWWTPGTATGYHAITQGFLVGELVRRISGKSLKQFIADELATPLGADFRLGCPLEDEIRTAELIPPPSPTRSVDPEKMPPIARKSWAIFPPSSEWTTREFRDAEIGAVNGFTNARALCQIGSIISLGGTVMVDNGHARRFLSPRTVDRILEERIRSTDLVVVGSELRFGLGFGLPVRSSVPSIPDDRKIVFWVGLGGSQIVMDVGRRTTISYTPNKFGNGPLSQTERAAAYLRAAFDVLDVHYFT